jgi:cytochrome c biogenesis protein ResB
MSWRLALKMPPAPAGVFDGGEAVRWRTRADAPAVAAGYFERRGFRLLREETPAGTEPQEVRLAASRFGVARLGPVVTHLGFLLLVVGAIALGLSGSAHMLWLRAGEVVAVPGSTLALQLDDFRIETATTGQIADYISTVTLRDRGADVRQARIEVNHPLRYRGYSFYPNAYRQNPTQLLALNVVTDAAPGAQPDAAVSPHGGTGPHGQSAQLAMPVTTRVPWGERVALPHSPYAVEIDTFFVDFIVGEEGPALASDEPRNPAVLLSFYEGDLLAGRSWYFVLHPGMAVGTAPAQLLLGEIEAEYMAGIEAATHPGAAWVWAGFVVMTLGSVFAFVLKHERIWLRLRRRPEGWEVAAYHPGATTVAPELAAAAWEQRASGLTVQLARRLEPDGPAPVRGTERSPA